MNRRAPPKTKNAEAAELIKLAQQNCIGCRVNWRLMPGAYTHPAPGGATQCYAVEQRQRLREIAARRKQNDR